MSRVPLRAAHVRQLRISRSGHAERHIAASGPAMISPASAARRRRPRPANDPPLPFGCRPSAGVAPGGRLSASPRGVRESTARPVPSKARRRGCRAPSEGDMSSTTACELLEHYSVVILPALVVAEQIGIPLPAVPVPGGRGAGGARARHVPLVIGAMAVVALAVDFGRYELGRRRGAPVLTRLCRGSLEPDTCVRRAESIFGRHGAAGAPRREVRARPDDGDAALAGVFAVGRDDLRSTTLRPCCSGPARGWRSATSGATPSRSSRRALPGSGARWCRRRRGARRLDRVPVRAPAAVHPSAAHGPRPPTRWRRGSTPARMADRRSAHGPRPRRRRPRRFPPVAGSRSSRSTRTSPSCSGAVSGPRLLLTNRPRAPGWRSSSGARPHARAPAEGRHRGSRARGFPDRAHRRARSRAAPGTRGAAPISP